MSAFSTGSWCTFFITIILAACSSTNRLEQAPGEEERALLANVLHATRQNHMRQLPVDDKFSQILYEAFLKKLDPNKEFFTQEELQQLAPYRTKLDEELAASRFDFFNLATSLWKEQILEVNTLTKRLLRQKFDLTTDESFEKDPNKRAYVSNNKALQEHWRQKIKLLLIEEVFHKENNRPQSDLASLKKEILGELSLFFEKQFDQFQVRPRSENLQLFVDAILSNYDVQTAYLSPEERARWNVGFGSRAFGGVGISYNLKNGRPVIADLLIGGPAWKTKILEKGDVILQIKEAGVNSTNLIGFDKSTITNLLIGKAGSKLSLRIRKPDGHEQDVELTREIIQLEMTEAALLQHADLPEQFGYIKLPRFYAGDEGSSAHVYAALKQLKQNKVKGLVLDLRNNQGGSAREACNIIGYFLDGGVVMQTKRRESNARQIMDQDGAAYYDGEVVVLVNARSGSASELTAGSLQDYGRAVVVGGKATYGKGTMQNFANLDWEVEGEIRRLGDIKMTVGLFYTARGRSPQQKGIIPDIILPDQNHLIASGERVHKNTFPNQSLAETVCRQTVNTNANLEEVKTKSKARIAENYRFDLALKQAHFIKGQQEKSMVSLNYERFRLAEKQKNEQRQSHGAVYMKIPMLSVKGLPRNAPQKPLDAGQIARKEAWQKKIKQDPYVEECLLVLHDLLGM